MFSFLSHIPFWAHKRLRWLFCLFVVFFLMAGLANYAYYIVKSPCFDVKDISSQLHKREAYAEKLVGRLMKQVQEKGINSVARNESLYAETEKNNVTAYIMSGDSLCWWSNNIVDVRSPGEVPYSVVFYTPTHNSYCVGVQRADSAYRYVVFIRLKQKPFKGTFASVQLKESDFVVPDDVQIVPRGTEGAVDVASHRGTYIFSLLPSRHAVHNQLFFWLTHLFLFVSLAFLFAFSYTIGSMVRAKALSRSFALGCYGGSFALLVILAACKWPESVFSTVLFSPTFYSSFLAASLGHLAVYTVAFFCFCFLVRRLFVSTDEPSLLKAFNPLTRVMVAQTVSALVFLMAYCLCIHLVYRSTMDVAISLVHDISFFTVVALLLVIPWFVFSAYFTHLLARVYARLLPLRRLLLVRLVVSVLGFVVVAVVARFSSGGPAHFIAWGVFSLLSLCSEVYCFYGVRRTMFYVALLGFLIINLTVAVCYVHCGVRNANCYALMAERLTNNANLVHNAADERRLIENGKLLLADKRFHALMTDTASSSYDDLVHFLLETYFDGFGNRFEIDVQVRPAGLPFLLRQGYSQGSVSCSPNLLSVYFQPLDDEGYFYVCKRPELPLAYMGIFPHKGKVAYVFLYPSISFYRQDQAVASAFSSHDFSVVKYYKNEMLFVSGDYHFPNNSSWIPNVSKRNFHIYKSDCTHYVSRFLDSGFLVVTKVQRSSYTYFIFVSYLCAIFALALLIYGLLVWVNMQRRHAQYSFLTRMQIWLLGPLLLAFLVLAFCSMYFFMGQYKNKAVSGMSDQAGSIQLNLQQKIGFASSLHAVDQRRFSQDIKDLSNLFRSDIVIYDADGRRITSSRTTFLNKGRRSKRLIYPVPLFLRLPDYFREAHVGDYEFFSYYTYLYNQRNQMVGFVNVQSGTGAEQMRNELFNLMVVLVDVYLVIVLLTIVVSWLISRRFTKPVAMLADQFKEIKLTGSNQKVEYADNDELGSLVQQYNVMVDKLQLSAEQLAQSQRELAWRDMARRIAHEIKNPLTPMKLSVQMAQMKLQRDPDNFPEYFEKTTSLLIEQIDNLSRIASEFSTFAKTTITVREEVDLASKVRSVVALFENNSECVRFELDMHGIESAMVWSDNKQILQVFNNLFRNAIQAIPESVEGVIWVDFQIKDEAVLIAVKDNGCGIPEENLQTIFEPNFTTKTSGMGLGLSIVKTIVNMASGDIWVESTVGVGSIFHIRIPLIKPGEKADDVSVS